MYAELRVHLQIAYHDQRGKDSDDVKREETVATDLLVYYPSFIFFHFLKL